MGIITFICASLSADMVPFTSGNTTEIENAVFEEESQKWQTKFAAFSRKDSYHENMNISF